MFEIRFLCRKKIFFTLNKWISYTNYYNEKKNISCIFKTGLANIVGFSCLWYINIVIAEFLIICKNQQIFNISRKNNANVQDP